MLVGQSLASKLPSLGRIQREKGQGFAATFLSAWLMQLNEILNLNKPMS
jgi:hypothetical protein